jgi:hypothetical protein
VTGHAISPLLVLDRPRKNILRLKLSKVIKKRPIERSLSTKRVANRPREPSGDSDNKEDEELDVISTRPAQKKSIPNIKKIISAVTIICRWKT